MSALQQFSLLDAVQKHFGSGEHLTLSQRNLNWILALFFFSPYIFLEGLVLTK